MLNSPTCKALKDAGYPQISYIGSWFHAPVLGLTIRSQVEADLTDAGEEWWVCPNSDELLAAIQERWPECALKLDLVDASTSDDPPDFELIRWRVRDGEWELPDVFETLVEALAALYIALAGGGA